MADVPMDGVEGQPVLIEELLFKTQHGLIDQSLHSRMGVETTNPTRAVAVRPQWLRRRLPRPAARAHGARAGARTRRRGGRALTGSTTRSRPASASATASGCGRCATRPRASRARCSCPATCTPFGSCIPTIRVSRTCVTTTAWWCRSPSPTSRAPGWRNHAAIAVAVDGLIAPGPQPPPTVADLAASVQALGLPHGTERSLMTKLGGAQRKLDAGHDAAACNTVGAILNEVNVHKVGPGDAAALSADARAVRDSLGCGSS